MVWRLLDQPQFSRSVTPGLQRTLLLSYRRKKTEIISVSKNRAMAASTCLRAACPAMLISQMETDGSCFWLPDVPAWAPCLSQANPSEDNWGGWKDKNSPSFLELDPIEYHTSFHTTLQKEKPEWWACFVLAEMRADLQDLRKRKKTKMPLHSPHLPFYTPTPASPPLSFSHLNVKQSLGPLGRHQASFS